MNEVDMRIYLLYEKVNRYKKKSQKWKALACVSLILFVFFIVGSKNFGTLNAIGTNIMWIVYSVAIIFIYKINVQCVKSQKAVELCIYDMELEDLNDKKEIAQITGEILPDYIWNKKIDKPDEEAILPKKYYGILLGIGILLRIYLLAKGYILS